LRAIRADPESIADFLDEVPEAIPYAKGMLRAIREKKIPLHGSPYEIASAPMITNAATKSHIQSRDFLKRKTNVMPRNPNLRIDLECDQGSWKFVLHKDSQAHCSARGYPTAEEAVSEAQVLVSLLRLAKDRNKRLGRPEVPTATI
jgi:hypothetical protein